MKTLSESGQFAVDRDGVRSMKGIRVHVESVEKCPENPVIVPDRPWEEDVHIFGSVLKINGTYRMWYYARSDAYETRSVCYAESSDGVHWVKPELGIVSYKGMDTNIVLSTLNAGRYFKENCGVIYTPWDTGKEYKMLYHGLADEKHARKAGLIQEANYAAVMREYEEKGELLIRDRMKKRVDSIHDRAMKFGEDGSLPEGPQPYKTYPCVLYTAWSSDGLHWNTSTEPSCYEIMDISHWFYDTQKQEYVIYGRGYGYDEKRVELDRDLPEFDACFGRIVVRTTSKDGLTFGKIEPVMKADYRDRPCDEIYSLSVFQRGNVYLGLVQMYHGNPSDMTLDVQLTISHDGVHFERVGDRNPILPLGGIGEWDRFNTSIGDTVVEEGDDIRIYHQGAVFRHTQIFDGPGYDKTDCGDRRTRIGFGSVKRDRFACAMASFDGGEILFDPMIIDGNVLCLNCVSAFGEIQVKLEGTESKKEFEAAVSENGLDVCIGLPDWVGKEPVNLKLVLKNARLYSYCAKHV